MFLSGPISNLSCDMERFDIKLGEPQQFLIRYRTQTKYLVYEVVAKRLSKKQSTDFIQTWAKENIPLEDNMRFVEVVETELLSLHIGNIAIYKIKEEEFKNWQVVWERDSN